MGIQKISVFSGNNCNDFDKMSLFDEDYLRN
jgi:hypothetical protein